MPHGNGISPLIHIGYPKALSTWLQKNLFQETMSFQTLMGPVGVQLNFIDPGAFSFVPDKVLSRYSHIVSRSALNQNTPVISSEALSGNIFCGGYNAKELADRLKAVFGDGKILIIIREQKAMLCSLYSTFISWGLPHSLDRMITPVDTRKAPQFTLEFLHYHKLIGYYQKLFGKESVKVLLFEQFLEDPVSFIDAILAFSGNQNMKRDLIYKLPLTHKENKGRNYANLMIQKHLNRLFSSNAFNYSGLFDETPERTLKRLKRIRRRDAFFPRSIHRWFEKSFNKKIEKISAEYFSQSNRRSGEMIGVELDTYGYQV